MNRFEVARPSTLAQAKDLVQEKAWSSYQAGGIDLIDHLKERLESAMLERFSFPVKLTLRSAADIEAMIARATIPREYTRRLPR